MILCGTRCTFPIVLGIATYQEWKVWTDRGQVWIWGKWMRFLITHPGQSSLAKEIPELRGSLYLQNFGEAFFGSLWGQITFFEFGPTIAGCEFTVSRCKRFSGLFMNSYGRWIETPRSL